MCLTERKKKTIYISLRKLINFYSNSWASVATLSCFKGGNMTKRKGNPTLGVVSVDSTQPSYKQTISATVRLLIAPRRLRSVLCVSLCRLPAQVWWFYFSDSRCPVSPSLARGTRSGATLNWTVWLAARAATWLTTAALISMSRGVAVFACLINIHVALMIFIHHCSIERGN